MRRVHGKTWPPGSGGKVFPSGGGLGGNVLPQAEGAREAASLPAGVGSGERQSLSSGLIQTGEFGRGVHGGELAPCLAGVPGCLQGGRFGRAKHSIVAAGVPGL